MFRSRYAKPGCVPRMARFAQSRNTGVVVDELVGVVYLGPGRHGERWRRRWSWRPSAHRRCSQRTRRGEEEVGALEDRVELVGSLGRQREGSSSTLASRAKAAEGARTKDKSVIQSNGRVDVYIPRLNLGLSSWTKWSTRQPPRRSSRVPSSKLDWKSGSGEVGWKSFRRGQVG